MELPKPEPDSLEAFVEGISCYEGAPEIGRLYWRTRNLDIKDIAKRMREDIKAKGWGKKVKVSVKIGRYAGGQSIDITANMPAGARAPEPATVRLDLEYIHRSYNYNASHGMYDYISCRYQGRVETRVG